MTSLVCQGQGRIRVERQAALTQNEIRSVIIFPPKPFNRFHIFTIIKPPSGVPRASSNDSVCPSVCLSVSSRRGIVIASHQSTEYWRVAMDVRLCTDANLLTMFDPNLMYLHPNLTRTQQSSARDGELLSRPNTAIHLLLSVTDKSTDHPRRCRR